jgi:uncharacterized spore protein YtfJ
MSDTKIAEIVQSLLSGVQAISKSETVVGEPQQAGDATIIPVHRLKIAFGAASANAGAHGARVGGDSGGHGAGGAVEIDPIAAIAVGKDGQAKLFTVEGEEKAGWAALLDEVPDLVGKLASALGERVRLELGAVKAQAPAIPAEPARQAALPDKSEKS